MTRRRFICYKLVIKNKYNATKKELCNSTTDWVINNCCCTGQSVFSALVAWPPGDNRKRWMATDATNGQSQCRQRERTRKNGLKPIIYCADSLFANNSVLITSERLSLDGLLLRNPSSVPHLQVSAFIHCTLPTSSVFLVDRFRSV